MPQGYKNRLRRRGYNQYTPSYQAAGYNPTAFEGSSMEFNPHDYSVLERGLANMETRMNKAAEQQGAVDEALAKIELSLNSSEREWFAGYKQDIKNQIQSDIDTGNYGTAIRKATKLAGQVASDSKILGRIEANNNYQKELERQKARVAKGEVDEDAYNWWLKKNPYTYQDNYDANGNVVSGTKQNFATLYDKINYAGITMSAFKLITADKGSTQKDNSNTVTNSTTTSLSRNNATYKPGEGVTTSSHSSNSFERITLDDIKNNINELIALTPGGFEQVEQEYEVKLNAYKELEEKYNKALETDPFSESTKLLGQQLEVRKKLLFKNGADTGFKEYFTRVLAENMFAQNLAYDWKTSSSGSTSSYSVGPVNNTDDKRNLGNNSNSSSNNSQDSYETPSVIRNNNGSEIVGGVNNAVNNVIQRFKK